MRRVHREIYNVDEMYLATSRQPPDPAGEDIFGDSHLGHLKRDVARADNNLRAAHPPTVRS